jgi:DNA polymerase III epsilon subunit-like protein
MIAAIDCEMCETSKGLEVTRVTILDHDSKVIVDLLVKPDHPIIDYRTNYSGITEAILQPITTKLIQIQILLLRLICSQTILIGHSLENDLKVLHFIHFKIIDTTLLYPHPQGFPYRSKLRYLAKEYLQLSIQQSTGSSSSTSSTMTKKEMKEQACQVKGHDSQEDASAAMKLVLLKMNKGPLFGLPSSIESESLRVPITKRLSYLKIPSLLIDYHPINSTNDNHLKDVDNKQEAASQSVLNQENHFLENLICQGSTMVKSHSLEDILAKIENFVISQQKQQLSSSSSSSSTVQEPEQQPGKGKKRSLDEEDNNNDDEDTAAIHELSSISQKNYDQPHFIHVTIPFQMDKKQEIQHFFQQLQTRLKPSLPISTDDNSIINTHGLLMITSQRPLQQIQQLLSKREKIFSNQKRMTSMVWTSEDEEKLKYLIKENSLGNVSFHIL